MQTSDKIIEVVREELNRLHQILNKPEEKPGAGHPIVLSRKWARDRIELLQSSLCSPLNKQLERDETK
jgi:hypothetical protein